MTFSHHVWHIVMARWRGHQPINSADDAFPGGTSARAFQNPMAPSPTAISGGTLRPRALIIPTTIFRASSARSRAADRGSRRAPLFPSGVAPRNGPVCLGLAGSMGVLPDRHLGPDIDIPRAERSPALPAIDSCCHSPVRREMTTRRQVRCISPGATLTAASGKSPVEIPRSRAPAQGIEAFRTAGPISAGCLR